MNYTEHKYPIIRLYVKGSQNYIQEVVNKVVPFEKLEEETITWCKEILSMSPTALKIIKSSFNADIVNIDGINDMALHSLYLYYKTEECREGSKSFIEKRLADYSKWR